ncbi:MAG: alpha/beta fold hydrolase [Deltaproteobacteria bacterium]|nr:MAG: alpha/beta fold hydrolase [Deltaproteobacteria bacterium]
MIQAPTTPARLYRALRDQLGSVRHVYLRSNRIVRHDDFAQADETVLLLHGFFQTRQVWQIMEDRLRADGYGVFSFDLGGLFWRLNNRSIDEQARMIGAKLEGIAQRYGLQRFHIVGHSMGGLIARTYIQHHGGAARVKSLVTLGTPHLGTPTAAIGVWLMAGGLLSASPGEMIPLSRFMRRLNRDVFPAHIPLTSIYSTADLVCPWRFSELRPGKGAGHIENRKVKGVGHTALTWDPGVYVLVRRALEDASRLWKEREQAGGPDAP